jgi:hypothetical protein
MTPEKQRIVLAEWDGWEWYKLPIDIHFKNKRYRCLFNKHISDCEERLEKADMSENICNIPYLIKEGRVPNYLEDLNAVHELEKKFNLEQKQQYVGVLCDLLEKIHPDKGEAEEYVAFILLTATSAQRCKAILRTIGKWEDKQ